LFCVDFTELRLPPAFGSMHVQRRIHKFMRQRTSLLVFASILPNSGCRLRLDRCISSRASGSMLLKLSRLMAALSLAIFAASANANAQVVAQGTAGVALVIGNGAYAQAPIANAVEGARAVADVLTQSGFKVLYLQNVWRDDVKQALVTFGQSLERGADAIIFFSGHAVQFQGRNYLVALDTNISGPDDIRREATDVSLLLEPLIAARTTNSVVILDASRANPWQPLLPGGLRGLAAPETVKGVSFVYATAPGKVVSSAPQASGVFAKQLAQAMSTPGLGFDDVISRTRSAVTRINGRDQVVWQSDGAQPELAAGPPVTPEPAKPADDVAELELWDRIRTSGTAADFQAYLNAYPSGQFALVARSRLAALQARPPQAAAPREAPTQQTAAVRPEPIPAPLTAPVPPKPAASASPATDSTTVRDCPVCPELVLIPAGTLVMGSADGFPFEAPVHEVAIPKPFYMGRREVTFDEWDACLSEGGCQYRPGDRGQGRGMRPVSDLDWNDAKAYVAWLSRKTGKTYRLPTEAEWEYAARAGTKTAFYWGNTLEKGRANCVGCTASAANRTVDTGSFPPNAFGLLDMAGNAAEWVEDCWSDNYKTAPKDGSANAKPDCRERVLRGGSFNNDHRYARTAARFKYDYDVRYYTNGFRVVRER
jgi:formylglycine-generating enzyme required for sulfatase activity